MPPRAHQLGPAVGRSKRAAGRNGTLMQIKRLPSLIGHGSLPCCSVLERGELAWTNDAILRRSRPLLNFAGDWFSSDRKARTVRSPLPRTRSRHLSNGATASSTNGTRVGGILSPLRPRWVAKLTRRSVPDTVQDRRNQTGRPASRRPSNAERSLSARSAGPHGPAGAI